MITAIRGYENNHRNDLKMGKQQSFGSIMPIKFVKAYSGESINASKSLIRELNKALEHGNADNSLRGWLKQADPHGFAKEANKFFASNFKLEKIFGKWCLVTGKDLTMLEKETPLKVFTDYVGEIMKKNHSARNLIVGVAETNLKGQYIPKTINSEKITKEQLLDLLK